MDLWKLFLRLLFVIIVVIVLPFTLIDLPNSGSDLEDIPRKTLSELPPQVDEIQKLKSSNVVLLEENQRLQHQLQESLEFKEIYELTAKKLEKLSANLSTNAAQIKKLQYQVRSTEKEKDALQQKLNTLAQVSDMVPREIVDGLQSQEKQFFKTMLMDMFAVYEYEDDHPYKVECLMNAGPKVNFIIPLRNRAFNFHRMLNSIEMMARNTSDCNLSIVLSLFTSTGIDIPYLLGKWSNRTGIESRVIHINTTEGFSRALGLARGIEILPENEIGFSMDADMVSRDMIKEGQSVYAPVCYSFNILQPRTQQGNKDHKRLKFDGLPTDTVEEHGFWRAYGTGMIGYFISDARKVGAYVQDSARFAWGLEDLHFVDTLKASGYEVRRQNHTNFFHVWHPKESWDKSDDGIM